MDSPRPFRYKRENNEEKVRILEPEQNEDELLSEIVISNHVILEPMEDMFPDMGNDVFDIFM